MKGKQDGKLAKTAKRPTPRKAVGTNRAGVKASNSRVRTPRRAYRSGSPKRPSLRQSFDLSHVPKAEVYHPLATGWTVRDFDTHKHSSRNYSLWLATAIFVAVFIVVILKGMGAW